MPPQLAPSASRVPELDGLRALAALSVFAFHLATRAPAVRDVAMPVVGHLDLGVEIFFVLSGFLVWRPFAAALARNRALPGLRSYAARRVARLWPGYLLVLITVIALGATTLTGPVAVLKHATLTYKYFEDPGGDAIRAAWSLVVEVSFYAFVPLLAVAITRWLRPASALLGQLLAPVALIVTGAAAQCLIAVDLDTWPALRILPPALLTLGIGMLFAAVSVDDGSRSRLALGLRRAAARPAACVGLAAVAFSVLALTVPTGSPIAGRPGDRIIQSMLQALIAGLLVLPIVLPSPAATGFRRALRSRVAVYLGVVSFGLYLWHIPVLALFRPIVRDPSLPVAVLGALGALTLATALAAASYHLVERPVLDRVVRRTRGWHRTADRSVSRPGREDRSVSLMTGSPRVPRDAPPR